MKCEICGKEIKESSSYEAILCGADECFHTWFWKNALDDEAIIIDQNCYHAAPEHDNSGFRGFGGRRFKIRMLSGKIIETTNLWHQGRIPDEFYRSDNAEFVNGGILS